jgi:hypothetical protein
MLPLLLFTIWKLLALHRGGTPIFEERQHVVIQLPPDELVATHPKAPAELLTEKHGKNQYQGFYNELYRRLSAVIKLLLSGKLSVINIVPFLAVGCVYSTVFRSSESTDAQLCASSSSGGCATATPFVQKGQW